MTDKMLTRRTLLRGAGTMMALPLLEGMLPLTAMASSAPAAPLRMAFMFVPNGINMAHWTPKGEGASYELPQTLAPLKNVRQHFNILSGLTQRNAEALGDGGGDHARSASAWLTGCHPVKTNGADIKVGISADQLAAQRLGGKTRFASLEIGCEGGRLAGDCDSGYSCAYSNSIAWRTASTPVAKETDPRLVFDRLFGSEDPTESAEARALRQKYNKSILDFVMEDASALSRKLGTHDRQKLDEYFTAVREIEQRINFLEKASNDAPAKVLQGSLPGNDVRLRDVPYEQHVRLMGDMMILAFQTDMTRISTFMLANEGSNRAYGNIGIKDGHHEISHHGRDAVKLANIQKINQFHVEQLAYMIDRMSKIKDGDKTLLDNTMLVYGGGISDGDRHNHDDLPILLAGHGGGAIAGGRHIRYQNGTPMTNLLLCMLDRMGIHAETLGDSTGRVQQLI